MFAVDVSARKRSMAMKLDPESQGISHNDQRQFFTATEKPEIRGPRQLGRKSRDEAQMQRM